MFCSVSYLVKPSIVPIVLDLVDLLVKHSADSVKSGVCLLDHSVQFMDLQLYLIELLVTKFEELLSAEIHPATHVVIIYPREGHLR